ncbi:MAG TPA: hypothetical protein VHB50_02480 [Bryobacteraceae bacterium]|nr:hypothetical protein [Bryobacteraceae bacterium]
MSSAWDQVISTAVAAATPDPSLTQAQPAPPKSGVDDFLGHFFFESRTDYERYQTNFTGNPTYSGVINAPDTGFFNPAGIPSTAAFQPGSNRIEEFLDFGTRGYGSDRVNTHFALRYRQDLTKVQQGSPAENIIETFYGNRLYEFLDASVEINSKPTDGIFAGTSLQFGRLNVYGAEIASFDGASVSLSRPKFDLTVYGGRRFSFFSDPEQRAIGGANLNLKLNPTTSVELETLWYIKGSNRAVLRKRLHDRWLITSYLRAYGGAPVDFEASALYSSRDGRSTMRGGFFQKLTNKDYTFDYTSDVRDLASKNPLYRLYLGPIEQYSQFNAEGHRQFLSRLRAGGEVVVRRLNSRANEGPFDTSFEDYRFNGQYFPFRKIETFFEYHQRNSDRLSPLTTTALDDLHATGETSVKDLTGEIRRSFGEGRFSLSGGVYYRRISMQDAFYYLNNLHQSGVLGSAWVRLDRRTRVYLDYSLDNDFFLFTPDLKNSQVFRLGVAWKY